MQCESRHFPLSKSNKVTQKKENGTCKQIGDSGEKKKKEAEVGVSDGEPWDIAVCDARIQSRSAWALGGVGLNLLTKQMFTDNLSWSASIQLLTLLKGWGTDEPAYWAAQL